MSLTVFLGFDLFFLGLGVRGGPSMGNMSNTRGFAFFLFLFCFLSFFLGLPRPVVQDNTTQAMELRIEWRAIDQVDGQQTRGPTQSVANQGIGIRYMHFTG